MVLRRGHGLSHGDRSWLAAYLFRAEPWDSFLKEAVSPFVETVSAEGLADSFFFVRYWERGPHIRLRFLGEACILGEVLKPRIDGHFGRYFIHHPSVRSQPDWANELPQGERWFPNDTVRFVEYEPEIERYGGPDGIVIAERQFNASSRTVLSIISGEDEWSYERALGAAIQMHLAFAYAMRMDLAVARLFFDEIFRAWLHRVYHRPGLSEGELLERKSSVLQAFRNAFSSQRPSLVDYHRKLWKALGARIEFEPKWINGWISDMSEVKGGLDEARRLGRLKAPGRVKNSPDVADPTRALWSILESYVHMTNNRLGILNRDEAFLGYLLTSSLNELVEG